MSKKNYNKYNNYESSNDDSYESTVEDVEQQEEEIIENEEEAVEETAASEVVTEKIVEESTSNVVENIKSEPVVTKVDEKEIRKNEIKRKIDSLRTELNRSRDNVERAELSCKIGSLCKELAQLGEVYNAPVDHEYLKKRRERYANATGKTLITRI